MLSGILMCICIMVNLSVAGYLSRLWHYPGLVQMLIIFNGVYILQGVLAQFQWIEQAHLRFKGILITTIIRQGGFFLFIFISFIFHTGISLMELIYIQAICTGIGAFTEYFY